MEWPVGGRRLEEHLEKLTEALRHYYGTLNELAASLKVEVPEKPEALVLYQQCMQLGIQLVSGGLMDQPFLWLQELGTVIDEENMQKMIAQRNAAQK